MESNSAEKTKSVCPVCLQVIEAVKVEKTVFNENTILSGVFMEKCCPEHGDFSTLIWEGSLDSYKKWNRETSIKELQIQQNHTAKGCPYDCGSCSEHEQQTCCVLMEITNQCNLHCPVCFASAGECVVEEPSLEKIGEYFDILMKQGGPFNIQLSGGEPTVRDDVCEIITLGKTKGFSFFQLNTNGLRIAEEEDYANRLKQAGLNCVFLQFDGITEQPYKILRGKPLLNSKLKAIEQCAKAGLGVVLVPTLVPGVNDHEIGKILEFAWNHVPEVRGIHFQPISYFGRCGLEAPVRRLTIPKVLHEIERQTKGSIKCEDFQCGGAEHPHCSFHGNFMKLEDGSIRALTNNAQECSCSSKQSREVVAKRWSAAKEGDTVKKVEEYDSTSLDRFLNRIEQYTLAVSGMVFQDAFNLDLERLKRCYICEITKDGKQIPFCAYNVTSTSGKSLYREQ